MATKKTTGTEVTKWDEELANIAKANAAGTKVSRGKFISFSGGMMSYGGVKVPNDELRCIIIGHINHNAYYEGAYDADNKQPPSCYAFGQEPEDMAPHEAALDKQHDNCAECPMNQWKSDGKKGKACKNTVRLAVIPEDSLENVDDLKKAEVVYISVSVTSVKNWNAYLVNTLLNDLGRPAWAVVTKVKRVPDTKSQFKIEFSMEELIEDSSFFKPLNDLFAKTMEGISFPYESKDESEAPKKPPAGKQKFARR